MNELRALNLPVPDSYSHIVAKATFKRQQKKDPSTNGSQKGIV